MSREAAGGPGGSGVVLAELSLGAHQLALDGALAGALAGGDLAVVEADCLECKVAAFAGGERVELGAAVQPLGDAVVELPGGRGGLRKLAGLVVGQEGAGGLLAQAGGAVPGGEGDLAEPGQALAVERDIGAAQQDFQAVWQASSVTWDGMRSWRATERCRPAACWA